MYTFFPHLQKWLILKTILVVHKSSTNYTILVLKILPSDLYLEATKQMILVMELSLSNSVQGKVY